MKKEYVDFYKMALNEWGVDSQLRMCIEEMSELTKEICKYMRIQREPVCEESKARLEKCKENIMEEIADAANMIEQLEFIFGEQKIEEIRAAKLEREAKRLFEQRSH